MLENQKVTSKVTDRKRKTKDPCRKCSLRKDLCICAVIPRIVVSTRLVLVVHAKELKRTTNTGTLALLALENSKMFVRGADRTRLDLQTILTDEFESLLLYPGDDTIELKDYLATRKNTKPIQLIVPDGNWRQAAKVGTRHPELSQVPRVKISAVNSATSHLRKEHFPEGFSTLEAIANAYAAIEGPAIGQQLMEVYQAKLQATLNGRPK